ncbi:MAG: hypothetical protein ACFFDN_01385 [Candidatus Hodarchaeota archaeon]
MNLKDLINGIVFLPIIISVTTSLFILFYVMFNDTILSALFEFATNLNSMGFFQTTYLNLVNEIIDSYYTLPAFLDKLFFASLVSTIVEVIYMSYFEKREGILKVFFWGSLGLFLTIFFVDMTADVGNWVKDLFFNSVLPSSITSQFVFFSLTMQHIGVICSLTLLACLISNHIPFNMKKYFSRKKNESYGDELI